MLDTTKVVNSARFLNICYAHNRMKDDGEGIGTLNEKRIHAVLKEYFDPDVSHHEIKHLGYVADIKNESGIIEIQTGALNPLFNKLSAFLKESRVTLVHPLPAKKTVSWIDPKTGDISPRHNSPVKMTPFDGLCELYNIRSHVGDPNLKNRFAMLEVDEYRYRDGWSRDGKRGSHRYDRIPIKLLDIIAIDGPDDYLQFLPELLRNNAFTTKDYAAALRIGQKAAYYALTVMTAAGATEKCGKSGNAILYKRII